MQWFAFSTVAPGVTRLAEPFVHPFFSANLFHVSGRDRDLVVDSGMGLAPLVSALELKPGKPIIALATHIHVDHVGGLHEFAERWGPAGEAQWFETMADEATMAHLFRAIADPVTRPPEPGWSAEAHTIRPAPLTRTLREGDTVDLGDRRFAVLELPGHSPGSIGLIDEMDGTFFSGDAIYQGGLVDDLPHSDRPAYRRTMLRLLDLDVSIVHPGHGDSFGRAAMRAIAGDYMANESG